MINESVLIAGLALLFAFSNGVRDSSSIVATVVSTRILSPRKAFLFCAVFEFLGAALLGTAVAATVGRGILGPALTRPSHEALVVLGAALFSALVWGTISWWRAWPTSNTQALFAGLVGAGFAQWGIAPFHLGTIGLFFVVLVLSPLLGLVLSFIFTWVARYFGEWMTPRVKPVVDQLHIVSCALVALAHGSNDGQMVMGLVLLATGMVETFATNTQAIQIPMVVRLLVAAAISSGMLMGGRRLLRRLGMSFYRIVPPQGACAQLTSAITVLTCAMAGFPASSTQVITGSILGAGVAKNPRAVRWSAAQSVVFGWVITLPAMFFFAAVLCWGLHHLGAHSV